MRTPCAVFLLWLVGCAKRPPDAPPPETPTPAPPAAPAPAPAAGSTDTVGLSCTFAAGDEIRLVVSTAMQTPGMPEAVTNRVGVTVTVSEVASDGYAFRWAFGDVAMGPRPEGIPEADFAVMRAFEQLDDGATLVFRTDREAKPVELVNADEVAAARARAAAAEAALSRLDMSPSSIASYWLGQVLPYHATLCGRYAPGEPSTVTGTTPDGHEVRITTAVVPRDDGTVEVEVTREAPTMGDLHERLAVELEPGERWPRRVVSDQRTTFDEEGPTHNVVTWAREP